MKSQVSRSKSGFPRRASVPLALAIVLLAALAGPQGARALGARICRVAAGAPSGGDGSTWAKAYNNLHAALIDLSCVEIWVKKGVYKPGTVQGDTFLISPGVKVYGGFAGTETVRSQRNPWTRLTILSGDIDKNDANHTTTNIDLNWTQIVGSNSYHVVTMSGSGITPVTATTVLDGFTITGGNASGSQGGGLSCGGGGAGHACSPTLAQLVFSGNRAQLGGGLFNGGDSGGVSSPTLTQVTFRGNYAEGYGGGMYNNGFNGGTSTPTLTNVTFTGNKAFNDGGGMHNVGSSSGVSSPILNNVTFSGNIAHAGGAIYNDGSNGGTSSPKLTNVTFSGNKVDTTGGAMYDDGFGGGVSHPTVVNTIFWGDLLTGGGPAPEIYNRNGGPTITYSDVRGGCASLAGNICGAGNINADPRLSPLGNYGGHTYTRPLKFGSPAVDHGTNIGCPTRDQRGIVRPLDGDGNGSKVCDMGATESRRLKATFKSVGTQDGWILESGENSTVGGSLNSTAGTFNLGDNASRKQYRGILSFITSSLPDASAVAKVQVKLWRQSITGGLNPFTLFQGLMVDLRKGFFGTAAGLQVGDFQATASKAGLGPFKPTPSGALYTLNLPTAANAYVNKLSSNGGVTQLRLRFKLDDNNNTLANYISFYSGNATTTSYRPQLVVVYYIP